MRRVLVTGGSGFIGTYLMKRLAQDGIVACNLDLRPPKVAEQSGAWVYCDIKNRESLVGHFASFAPDSVIHLAANASLQGAAVSYFKENTFGTENVVFCVNETDSVEKFLFASTQYVVRPGVHPTSDEFLEPYTAYGESKAEAERAVRRKCKKAWVILRPTNIWGPLHPFFPSELWLYLERRLYVHPGFQPIRKYYGYVENAVEQILAIAKRAGELEARGRVLYISDPPIDSYEWMTGFSMALSGKPVRRVPLFLWRAGAVVGDALNAVGVRFPVSSPRLFRLTVNESIPYERTMAITGDSRVSLQEGIARSVRWYRRGGHAAPSEA
jgi:nucleoside-diphosphate-sugar epimerase